MKTVYFTAQLDGKAFDTVYFATCNSDEAAEKFTEILNWFYNAGLDEYTKLILIEANVTKSQLQKLIAISNKSCEIDNTFLQNLWDNGIELHGEHNGSNDFYNDLVEEMYEEDEDMETIDDSEIAHRIEQIVDYIVCKIFN